MQVPVQLLEASVDVGQHRHQEDLDIERRQTEGLLQAPETEIGARGLCLVGPLLGQPHELARVMDVEAELTPAAVEQVVGVLVGDIEAPETVVGIRVGLTEPQHGLRDPLFDRLQAGVEMLRRRISHRRRRPRRRTCVPRAPSPAGP